jgi:hypothetical protein
MDIYEAVAEDAKKMFQITPETVKNRDKKDTKKLNKLYHYLMNNQERYGDIGSILEQGLILYYRTIETHETRLNTRRCFDTRKSRG